jgi:hypothetical protein
MSSTRNNKRTRQQQQQKDEGGGSSAAASTNRRRSRDQRAQAASSKPLDPGTEDDAPKREKGAPSDDTTTSVAVSSTPGDKAMIDTSGTEAENDAAREQLPQHDDGKISEKDTDQQSSLKDVPSNGKNVHNNPPRNTATGSQETIQHTRSTRSSPVPMVDVGESSSDGRTDHEQRLPLHISTEFSAEDREVRIQDLIAHRSMLLGRVRACRESAERRIRETVTSSALISEITQGKELTKDEEITAFREMTQKANPLSKRPRTDGDALSEKRTSFSLRRGSGVGRKMNAALSLQAPASVAAATVAATNGTTVGVNPTQTVPVTSTIDPIAPKGTPAVMSRSISPKFGSTALKIPSNQQSAFNPSVTPSDPLSRGRVSAPKTPRMNAAVSPGIQAPPSSIPRPSAVDATQRMASNGTNAYLSSDSFAYQQAQAPRVHFPEAEAVRDRRDIVRDKLRALLERQQPPAQPAIRRVGSWEEDGRVSTIKSPGKSFSHIHHQQRSSTYRKRKIGFLEIPSPTPLPDRRRTHWDTVMQEMSWLAADFIQERQWKVSCARVLSSVVPGHTLVKLRSSSASDLKMNPTNNESVTKKSLQDRKAYLMNEDDAKLGPPDNYVRKKSAKKEIYPQPSPSDDAESKCNALVLSLMISELSAAICKGGAVEMTDKYHREGLQRFMNATIKLRHDFGLTSGSDDKTTCNTDKMEVDKSINDMTEKIEETTQEKISERIDRLHKIGKSRHKSTAREYANALKSKQKINLHLTQKNVVDFVEKLWGGDPSPGAVISGPVTSGKTYATATLLWKHRSNGPQLLVCPSSSVVSQWFQVLPVDGSNVHTSRFSFSFGGNTN